MGVVHQRDVEQAAAVVVEQEVVEQLVGPGACCCGSAGDAVGGCRLVVGWVGERVHAVVAGVQDPDETGRSRRGVLVEQDAAHLGVAKAGEPLVGGERVELPVRRAEHERVGRGLQPDEHADRPNRRPEP